MGSPRLHFSDEQLAEIRERYQGGVGMRTLARQYGCSGPAIQRQLVLMGVYQPAQLRSLTDAEKSDAAQRYRAGESASRLAEAYGCSAETVRKALVRLGTEMRTANRTGRAVVFSDEQLTEIRTLYGEGIDVRSLASLFGCNWKTMQQQLVRMGLYRPAKRKPFTKAEKTEMARRYKAGDTPAAIGRDYSTNGDVITRALRAAGVFDPDRYRYGKFTPRQVERMAERYRAGVTIYRLAKDYKCSVNGVWKVLVRHGVEMRSKRQEGRKGEHGKYVSIQIDPSDPLAAAMGWANGFLLEHRLVMARQLGRPLEKHETVHHINGDTHDNRPGNLQLRNGKHGKGVSLACLDCGSHNIGSVPI